MNKTAEIGVGAQSITGADKSPRCLLGNLVSILLIEAWMDHSYAFLLPM